MPASKNHPANRPQPRMLLYLYLRLIYRQSCSRSAVVILLLYAAPVGSRAIVNTTRLSAFIETTKQSLR
jgi:hypothetical protein